MGEANSASLEAVLDQLKDWSATDRVRLARRLLETAEDELRHIHPRARTPLELAGLLRTNEPPPSDEDCRSILEEELLNKHLP